MRRRLLLAGMITIIATVTLFHESCAQDDTHAADSKAWFGTLNAGPINLRLRIDVVSDDGSLSGVMTSLDQGNVKIPLDSIAMDGDKFTFAVEQLQCEYEGTKKGATYVGTFTQMGRELPLTLKFAENADDEMPKRPQLPKEPYPYDTEEVTFTNAEADNVTLAGTLTMPTSGGPFPAVILVSGSGPQDRDESLMGHKPFLVLADHLTRNGIAVLRFDDRGIGKSTGDFATATSADFASDAAAGISYLANHKRIDPQRIGLVGHSEGGTIGSMLAAKNDQLAHAVFLAGPGVTGAEIICSQTKAMSEAAGVEDQKDVQLVAEIVAAVKDGATTDELIKIADKYLEAEGNGAQEENGDAKKGDRADDDKQGDSEEAQADKKAQQLTEIATRTAITQFGSPWFRYFIQYDPRTDLANAKCPILAMNGSKDLQVLVDLNLPAIEQALRNAPAQGHRAERLEGLNHLFQTSETGLPAEYGQIEETMAPQALKMVSDWILAH